MLVLKWNCEMFSFTLHYYGSYMLNRIAIGFIIIKVRVVMD